jgi:hypothetical protein
MAPNKKLNKVMESETILKNETNLLNEQAQYRRQDL